MGQRSRCPEVAYQVPIASGLEPTTRSGDPTGFPVHTSTQLVLSVAQSVSSKSCQARVTAYLKARSNSKRLLSVLVLTWCFSLFRMAFWTVTLLRLLAQGCDVSVSFAGGGIRIDPRRSRRLKPPQRSYRPARDDSMNLQAIPLQLLRRYPLRFDDWPVSASLTRFPSQPVTNPMMPKFLSNSPLLDPCCTTSKHQPLSSLQGGFR